MPPDEPTPSSPAPESTPAPAPAEPAAPAAPVEPAAPATAAPAPSGEYPVVAEPERVVVAKTIWGGESVELTQSELDRLSHVGFSHLQSQQTAATQPAKPAAAAPEGAEPPDDMTQMRQELATLRQELNVTTYEGKVRDETKRINEGVDAEMPKHKVLADNPDLQAMARRSILATLSHNPRMSEESATKQVASELGAALNKQRDNWIKGKVGDAEGAEASPGAEGGTTPRPKTLTGKDLQMGRVRDSALRRLGTKELIGQ